jgi:hypothetical protein
MVESLFDSEVDSKFLVVIVLIINAFQTICNFNYENKKRALLVAPIFDLWIDF